LSAGAQSYFEELGSEIEKATAVVIHFDVGLYFD